MRSEQFLTASLRAEQHGLFAAEMLAAAIQAADPAEAVRQNFFVRDDMITAGDFSVRLQDIHRVFVVGAGKAGYPMAQAVYSLLGNKIAAGIVLVKYGHAPAQSVGPIAIIEAGHPNPDENGANGAARMAALLEEAGPNDLVIAVISGGGSALLTAPAAGVSLADLQEMTKVLLACGAPIHEINCLRKHTETLKGGGLALKASPAQVISLILSDVVGNPLESIASGPTAPDSTTFANALETLDTYAISAAVPAAILQRLRAGADGLLPETPRSDNELFRSVHNVIAGSNRQAALAALAYAESKGMHTLLLTTWLQGEAKEAGHVLGAIAHEIARYDSPVHRPCVIAVGGETTVTIRGSGLGGRNQEMALSLVEDIAGLSDCMVIAFATDGTDGPTDAAGAVVTGKTSAAAQRLGLIPAEYLRQNNSYAFFAALQDLLLPGPTQTNVNDLAFIIMR